MFICCIIINGVYSNLNIEVLDTIAMMVINSVIVLISYKSWQKVAIIAMMTRKWGICVISVGVMHKNQLAQSWGAPELAMWIINEQRAGK